MAFRGRGGARGRGRGRGRGGGRGSHGSSRLARSGIRTRGGGYKKFDSQRVRDIDQDSAGAVSENDDISSDDEGSASESEEESQQPQSYAVLLQSLQPDDPDLSPRPVKRRRLEQMGSTDNGSDDEGSPVLGSAAGSDIEVDEDQGLASEGDDTDLSDQESTISEPLGFEATPYETHFGKYSDVEASSVLSSSTYDVGHSQHKARLLERVAGGTLAPATISNIKRLGSLGSLEDLPLKPRLQARLQREQTGADTVDRETISYIMSYADVMVSNRKPVSAASLRKATALHAVNHVLTGRDRILKNSARLAQADDDSMLELRDQGFTRPKVLILLETRQMCAKYADCIADLFQPDQQENKHRFQTSFHDPVEQSDMPDDHQELFEGNNDNNFITTIKFTRKTLKFFSAFYRSDIILASPLGLRRIIEHEDKKKRDHDFLSSIEIVIVDQTDAMQMQNWENVELVFKSLNLQPKELRDCDVNRVRNWYLDGNAKHFRQTILFSAYLTPEMNRLFNAELQNIAGRVKISQSYTGAIQAATGLGVKQIFSRFPSRSPLEDPDSRFKFFTSSVLPSLLRIPRPAEGGQGILIFVPSYFDFLRVRNFFATSTMTENVSFGAIHDYSEVSDQRRARSHFVSGKHSILLYTQRAHHFFRLRLRGVKRAVLYGVPDNPTFYSELVAGFIGTSMEAGIGAGECFSRTIFSKFDALSMERVVGSDRFKNMLVGTGDTFEFV